MPINFKIDPTLNLLYYMGTGLCTASEFFTAERAAFQDEQRDPEMKIIVDIQFGEVDWDLQDLRALIALNKKLTQESRKLEMTAVVTNNSYFQTLGEVTQLLADGIPIKLGIFHTIYDAVNWLELSEHKEQIIQIRDTLKENNPGTHH